MIFTGALLTLLLIYGWSAILYAYVYSYLKNTLVSSMLVFIAVNFITGIFYTFFKVQQLYPLRLLIILCLFFTGMFINTGLYILKDLIREYNRISFFNTLNLLRLIVLIIPHFSFPLCLLGFLKITWANNMCKVCKSPKMIEVCKGKFLFFFFLFFISNINNFNILAIGSKRKNYFVFKSDEDPNGILEESLFLLLSSILYISIILLFDYKIFHPLYWYLFHKIYGAGVSYRDVNEDPDVGSERDKVNAAKTHSSNK